MLASTAPRVFDDLYTYTFARKESASCCLDLVASCLVEQNTMPALYLSFGDDVAPGTDERVLPSNSGEIDGIVD